MMGWFGEFSLSLLAGFGLWVPFLLFAGRFTERARREGPPRSFWRLLGKVFIEDIGIGGVMIILIAPTIDDVHLFNVHLFKSAPGWLGGGLAGLVDVALLGLLATKQATTEERRYYRVVFLIDASAIVALTVLECVLSGLVAPWLRYLLIPAAVFIGLSVCIYAIPPMPRRELQP